MNNTKFYKFGDIMITKNANPAEFLKGKNIDPMVGIYFQINHLKHLLRQGWLERGIPEDKCESVGDHTFAVAFFAMMIAKKYSPKLDAEKVLKMSLVHEFGEVEGGDITPHDGISKKDKHALEERGIRKMFAGFPEGKEYLDLWLEYAADETPEAKFVKQVDKLEMAMQSAVYSKQYGKDLSEFIDSARARINDKKLISLLDELKKI